MCTVAILPTADGGYLLGHNRDELRDRSRAHPPREPFHRGGLACLAPVDPDGGGSWILVNQTGLTLCLLNAAQGAGVPLPPNARSRGRVVIDLAEAACVAEAEQRLQRLRDDLRDTRGFHLVAVQPGSGSGPAEICRVAWDGLDLTCRRYRGPTLFTSNPLHQADAERVRFGSWRRFLGAVDRPDTDALGAWLANHEPEKNHLSTCMHRDEACTVSRTLVDLTAGGAVMHYTDGSPCEPDSPVTEIRLGVKSSVFTSDPHSKS